MTKNASILIVDPDLASLSTVATALRSAEYRTSVATSFEEAARLLSLEPPALMITALRLGLFNGLHLVLRARSIDRRVGVVVLGEPGNRGLRSETERLGARYLEKPIDEAELLATVASALGSGERRRWPRKAVQGPVEAMANDLPITLIEVSYSGLRFETQGTDIPPTSFEVRLPAHGVRRPAKAIWAARRAPLGPMLCGAMFDATAPEPVAKQWQDLVDTIPLTQQGQPL